MTKDRHFAFDTIQRMNQPLPQIRFKYGWLLADVTADALNQKNGANDPLGTYDELVSVTKRYETWWTSYNDQILAGICSILDLSFKQNIIDVYVSPWFTPISDPLVIGPAFASKDKFICTIAHELVHRLLTDNTSVDMNRNLLEDWKVIYGDTHEKKMLVHIPVHAVLKQLYTEIMNRPDLLDLDIRSTKDNKPYADAWAYIQSHGYAETIKALTISKSS